jgi:hypothetical protein
MPRQLLGLHMLAGTLPDKHASHSSSEAIQFLAEDALSGRTGALTDVCYWGKNGNHLDRAGCRVLDPQRTSPHFFPDDPVKHKRSGPFTGNTHCNSDQRVHKPQQWLKPSILRLARRNDHDDGCRYCR